MAHARCMLDIKGYKYTLTLCSTYSFSSVTMIARTRLIATLIRTLPVLFSAIFDLSFAYLSMSDI